jgi:hypothetical protein
MTNDEYGWDHPCRTKDEQIWRVSIPEVIGVESLELDCHPDVPMLIFRGGKGDAPYEGS